MATTVKFCICKHVFQDAEYGPQKRVFNQTAKDDEKTWRCTVCGTEKNFGKGGVTNE